MEVILAGHNIDYEIIREIAAAHPERQDLTPETVAAAYARISRNPRPVNELRADRPRRGGEGARLQPEHRLRDGAQLHRRARRLQPRHPRGLPPPRRGDRKVPPRLLHRKIPALRPASGRFRHPRTRSGRPAWRRSSSQPSGCRTAVYHELYEKLRPFVFETNPELAADPANRSLLEGWAKEDARYCHRRSPRKPSSG